MECGARGFAQEAPVYVVTEFDCLGDKDEERALAWFRQAQDAGLMSDGVMSQSERQARELWRYREGISEAIAAFTPYKNDLAVTVAQVPAYLAVVEALLRRSGPQNKLFAATKESLARGYAGTESLIWIGATMTAFPIFYAVMENDLRRVLAYSLNNQLGFMVVGIGIGTELALNGTAAHAFSHILYKALLFMSMGAVLLRVGTIKGSELGGLYKSMPYTTIFCIVGAASISGFPFFSGFVTKSLVLTATADGHYIITWFVLLFASAGVFHHSGIKIPFFAIKPTRVIQPICVYMLSVVQPRKPNNRV